MINNATTFLAIICARVSEMVSANATKHNLLLVELPFLVSTLERNEGKNKWKFLTMTSLTLRVRLVRFGARAPKLLQIGASSSRSFWWMRSRLWKLTAPLRSPPTSSGTSSPRTVHLWMCSATLHSAAASGMRCSLITTASREPPQLEASCHQISITNCLRPSNALWGRVRSGAWLILRAILKQGTMRVTPPWKSVRTVPIFLWTLCLLCY